MVNILDYIDKMQVMYGDKDPSSMAQEPRNMFADGQLVRPNDDGSRPGYSGEDSYNIERAKKRKEAKAKGLVYDPQTKKFRKSKMQPSEYGTAARVDGKRSPEYYREYYKANKVLSEKHKKRLEQNNKLKNFVGKKKKIKASVLRDFVLNDVGYSFYNADQIKKKFPNLIIEKDLSTTSPFEPLTKQQKTTIKENFNLPEGVEKWNFKKHKYGISSDKYNILSNQIINKLEKRKYKVAGNFSTPEGWMMNAMYRLYDKELEANVKNLTYEPKFNKKGIIVGFTDNTAAGEGRTYYATEKAANDFGDGTEWRGHGDFDRVSKFIKIADGVKAKPDEVLNKLLDEKGINQLIKGKRALSLNDVLSHQRYYSTLAETSPKQLISRQIVLHHKKRIGSKDLAKAAATQDLQLLTGAVNAEVTKLENIVKGSSKNPARKLTNAEKLKLKNYGARIQDFDGKIVGGGYTDPTKQFAAIEKEALKYAKSDKFNVKTVASYLERLGCGKAAGGRILMSNGGATLTKCAKAGQQKLTKGLTNGFGSKTEGELAKRILQAGRGMGSMFALRNILGPAAVGFTVAAEAGLVGYDMLATGKSFKEAVGASLFNYALGDKTKIDNKKLRYQGYADAGVSENQIGKISAFENAMDEMNNTFAEFDEENRLYNIAANQKGSGRMSEQRYKELKQQQAENFYNQADKNKALIQDLARTQTEDRLDKALDPMVPALMSDADAKRKAMQLTKPSTVKFGNFMDTVFPSGFFSDTTYKEDRDKAVNYMPEVQEYYRGNRFARGGLSGGDTSGPPPESGPMSQGLRSLYKNGRKL
jgi:predicted metal-binding transcription factor (methanogenesis marker protein 9)